MPAPAQLREVARVRVIYADTDQMGTVYHGTYFRYLEIARVEFLRQAGVPYRELEETMGLRLPVVEAGVRYRRPARYDEELSLRAALPDIGRASARFVYEIRRLADGELLVEGHTVLACVDAAGKVNRIPDGVRAALSATT